MPAKNPRLNVVITQEDSVILTALSEKKGISRSSLAKELIEKALDLEEDLFLNAIATEREVTLAKKNAIPEEEFWEIVNREC